MFFKITFFRCGLFGMRRNTPFATDSQWTVASLSFLSYENSKFAFSLLSLSLLFLNVSIAWKSSSLGHSNRRASQGHICVKYGPLWDSRTGDYIDSAAFLHYGSRATKCDIMRVWYLMIKEEREGSFSYFILHSDTKFPLKRSLWAFAFATAFLKMTHIVCFTFQRFF